MADYDRLDKLGLQYLLTKLKTQIESSVPADMTGATSSEAGTHGQVPAPAAGDQAKFLRGDGTWAVTPYPSTMTGADGTNAGAAGLVPAPAATDDTKYLKGDGTWATITMPTVPITEIDVNGSAITPVNGVVNITVPTAVSDLTNDSNFQTDTEVEEAIAAAVSSAYKAAGSKTGAEFVAALLVATNEGKVYNASTAFTTTSDFIEGAGQSHPAGTNVVVINNGTEAAPVYKFDVLAGFVDLSGYVQASEMSTISNSEIDTIWANVFNS